MRGAHTGVSALGAPRAPLVVDTRAPYGAGPVERLCHQAIRPLAMRRECGGSAGAVACAAVVGNATNEAIRTGGGRFGEVGVVIEAVSISKPLAFPLENVTSCSTYT